MGKSEGVFSTDCVFVNVNSCESTVTCLKKKLGSMENAPPRARIRLQFFSFRAVSFLSGRSRNCNSRPNVLQFFLQVGQFFYQVGRGIAIPGPTCSSFFLQVGRCQFFSGRFSHARPRPPRQTVRNVGFFDFDRILVAFHDQNVQECQKVTPDPSLRSGQAQPT